jgi:hypothetical protein
MIDNKPYTFNPNNKRWEPGATPDSGQQPLQAANVVPPTTPSTALLSPASQVPVPPVTPSTGMKGAFFSGGYGLPSNMLSETKKQFLALQMKHLQQQWENA